MHKIFLILLTFTVSLGYSQKVVDIKKLSPAEEYKNISIQKIDTDDNKTSFVIWVKENVKAHKHEHHTETLYVLEGEGVIRVYGKEMKIKEGDYLNIPENTIHSVVVTSENPLKVLSVQSPEFLGKDRIFVD